MLKKKLTLSEKMLIILNLIPVVGVWFLGWSPVQIFLVYAVETIVLGVFTIIKLAIATLAKGTDTWYNGPVKSQKHGLFFIFFFLIHYGLFVGIQLALFAGVSGIGKDMDITPFNFFIKWPELMDENALTLLAGFIIYYLADLWLNFLRPKIYIKVPMMMLMFQPYGRIFIQQVTVILGSLFLTFGAGKIFILIFACIKILFEVLFSYDAILRKGMKDLEEKNQSGQ